MSNYGQAEQVVKARDGLGEEPRSEPETGGYANPTSTGFERLLGHDIFSTEHADVDVFLGHVRIHDACNDDLESQVRDMTSYNETPK